MKQSNSLFNRSGLVGIAFSVMATVFGVTSCTPDYDLDKHFPEWLGTSIFETLSDGFEGDSGKVYKFDTFVRLIQDLDQEKILAKTGSKTLFVADDAAFARFFGDNCPFKKADGTPVRSYDELSIAQKTMILKGAMLNNVYQVAMLSSCEGPKLGDCMRRLSSSSVYDTIPVLLGKDMPDSPLWSYLKNDPERSKAGIPIMQDGTIKPLIFFVNKFLTTHRITDDDYDFLFNQGNYGSKPSRKANDASVNGVRIEYQNKKCFNGFIHVMEDVVYLLPSMAEYLEHSDNSIIYSSILERFSAPFYPTGAQQGVTSGKTHKDDVKRLIEDGKAGGAALEAAMKASGDSVYTKMYFSKRAQGNTKWNKTPTGKTFGYDAQLLKFDPGWNSFYSETSSTTTTDVALQQNMAVMLVPTDETLTKWWLYEGGKALRERYGLDEFKDNPPTTPQEVARDMSNIDISVIVKLINNNMLNSLTGSVPSKFSNVLNDANDPMFEDPALALSQMEKVVMCCNGAIYFTNAVYAPTAYRSVSYPALVNEKLEVFKWAIDDEVMSFSAYLNSMVSTYSFFVPEYNTSDELDEELKGKLIWVDPSSFAIKKYRAQGTDGEYLKALAFSYDDLNKTVKVDIYNYNDTTNQILDKVSSQPIDGTTDNGLTYLRDRLEDILDYHIIIGDVESSSVQPDDDGYAYFRTKGRGTIRFKNAPSKENMEVAGGWQIETGQKIKIVDRVDLSKGSSSNGNGRTYIIDRPLQTSRMSVYDILSDNVKYPQFSKFFQLMQSATGSDGKSLFDSESNKNDIGSRFCVTSFNTYHYTVYVPTNESLQALEDNGILVDPQVLAKYDEDWSNRMRQVYDEEFEGDEAGADKAWKELMIQESRRLRGASADDPGIKADSTFDYKKNYSDVKRDQLKNFIKYHIQDNAVFCNAEFDAGYNLDGSKATETNYETAYMRESDKQFAKLKVKGGSDIEITDANGNVRHVLRTKTLEGQPLWNIMCREYEFKNGTSSGLITDVSRAMIETSSYVVIHQIDGPLCNGDVKF